MSNGLIIALFVVCFGFVPLILLYRAWNFRRLYSFAAQQGWTVVGAERPAWLLLVTPIERRIFSIEGKNWCYKATSRVSGVRLQVSNDRTRAHPTRTANAVWSGPHGGSPRPIFLIPMMKGGRDPLDNPVLRMLFDPSDLATDAAQLVAEDYPAGEKLVPVKGRSVADYNIYASDEDTANRLLELPELAGVLAGWTNATERYANRPGILLYPGGVCLSTKRVETHPKRVQRLIELGEGMVRITGPFNPGEPHP